MERFATLLANLASCLDHMGLPAEADAVDHIIGLAAEIPASEERDQWSRELDDRGRKSIPSFAEIAAMQTVMLPHLRHNLHEQKAVDGKHAAETHPSGQTELRTFNRIPWHLVERLHETGIWIHSLRNPVKDGNLAAEIAEFKSKQGEVAVSRPKDNWYHGRKGVGTIAFVIGGIPRYTFKRDVGSDWDRWTGRRYLDPALGTTRWIDRTEAWLVPARSHFMGVITDIQKYIEQAKQLGILLSNRPALLSSNPKVLVPDRLEHMATPWPNQSPKGFLYWLAPIKPYAQGNRRGFATPKLISWLERNKATMPGFEEFGHKGAGFMVLFDHGVELPPFDKDFRQFSLKRINAPAIRTEDLPPALQQGGRGASAIRYSIIQAGEPFRIDERTGTFHTTDEGAQRLSAFLRGATIPLSRRS